MRRLSQIELLVGQDNQHGTAEQHIKEGKNAIKWTRLSCRTFQNNVVRLQLHALAYNLGNFMRTLALPKGVEHWSLTTLREKLVKIGAKVISRSRYVTFQMAEVAVPRELFQKILKLIDNLAVRTEPGESRGRQIKTRRAGKVCQEAGFWRKFAGEKRIMRGFWSPPTRKAGSDC